MTAIAGCLIVDNFYLAIAAVLCVLLPMLWTSRLLGSFAKLFLPVGLPISIMLLVIWGFIIGAAPGMEKGTDLTRGIEYAGLVTARLSLLVGIGQLTFLTIPRENLAQFFRRCGVTGGALAVLIGSVTLIDELRLRADQVLVARYARGLLKLNSFPYRIAAFPFIIRPLLAYILRSALLREELWSRRDLIRRLESQEVELKNGKPIAIVFFAVISVTWLIAAVYVR